MEGNRYLSECVINNVGMLEMIIREEVELIQEVPDINAAEGIHLRKREDAGESKFVLV